MGTRSLTHFVEEGEIIATLYRQYDGYLEGHGCDLAAYLADSEVVNGIPMNAEARRVFNGIGDLTVRTIAALKDSNGGLDEPGNFYMLKAGSAGAWEEYTYEVRAPLGEEPRIICREEGIDLTASEFLAKYRTR